MFKLKVNERFVGSRKAYTERDVDNYYKDEFIQERISKLIGDIEKKKCFGLQDVESVDESFDYDHSIVIETSDPRIIELAEDEGLNVSSTVKLVLDMDDLEELRLILDSEGEASEINNYFISFKNYKSLLDTVQEAIESLIKGKTASKRRSSRVRKAGTGYWIDFDMEIDSVGEPKVKKIVKGKTEDRYDQGYAFHEDVIPFEMDVEIPVKININSANSYMYGIEYPYENVDAVITRVSGYAPVEETDFSYYWNIDNPKDVREVLKELDVSRKLDPTYNSGWVHVPFEGELNNVEFYEDVAGICAFDLKILDQGVVDEIEYQCSGDAYMEEMEEEESEYPQQ